MPHIETLLDSEGWGGPHKYLFGVLASVVCCAPFLPIPPPEPLKSAKRLQFKNQALLGVHLELQSLTNKLVSTLYLTVGTQ